MSADWADSAVFYHIYPLGLLGAPARNAPELPADGRLPDGSTRLDRLAGWLDHIAGLGCDAVYLGPVFESTAHGYDTADYFRVDRRLGDNAALRRLVDACHARGLRVALDAVLNHVGRGHAAFESLRREGRASPYAGWFKGLDFGRDGPCGDGFAYEGWHGHYDLAKLDTSDPGARGHLLDAVRFWIAEFDIDGLRLDAADCLAFDFLDELRRTCDAAKPDFWLMGEVVHGDYNDWARPGRLHSVTNYEAYKGLWSSLNDGNYFEIDWTLKRQFGPRGMYAGLGLYNFVDNHDVNRAASILKDPRQLDCLYAMLFAMPGAPSIYYGSEWGLAGERLPHSDAPLRPALDLPALAAAEREGRSPQAALCGWIARLARARRDLPALRRGDWRPALTAARQYAFWRGADWPGGAPAVLAAFNADAAPARLRVGAGAVGLVGRGFRSALDGRRLRAEGAVLEFELPAFSAAWWVAE